MTIFFLTAGVLFELLNPYRTSCEKNTRRFQSVSKKKLNQGEGGGRVQSDIRAILAGVWKYTALEAGVWIEMVTGKYGG